MSTVSNGNDRDGSENNAYDNLQSAITRAYEIGA